MTTRTNTGLLATKESNLAFRAAFRKLAREKKLTAELMALYAMVTGKPMGAVFSPITNAVKLANGQDAWLTALHAAWSVIQYPSPDALALRAAAGLDTPEGLESLKAIRKSMRASDIAAQYASRNVKAEA